MTGAVATTPTRRASLNARTASARKTEARQRRKEEQMNNDGLNHDAANELRQFGLMAALIASALLEGVIVASVPDAMKTLNDAEADGLSQDPVGRKLIDHLHIVHAYMATIAVVFAGALGVLIFCLRQEFKSETEESEQDKTCKQLFTGGGTANPAAANRETPENSKTSSDNSGSSGKKQKKKRADSFVEREPRHNTFRLWLSVVMLVGCATLEVATGYLISQTDQAVDEDRMKEVAQYDSSHQLSDHLHTLQLIMMSVAVVGAVALIANLMWSMSEICSATEPASKLER